MISLKKWMTKVSEALDITVADYTATTGTEQYAGWYYANITLTKVNPSAITVVYSQSNRPAFAYLASNSIVRVYCNQASIEVKVRCLYIPTGSNT